VSHWLRLLLSVLALVGLLAGASGTAVAKMAGVQTAAHQCCPQRHAASQHHTASQHPAPGKATPPDCCAAGLCACVQPLPPPRLILSRLAPQPVAARLPSPRAWRKLASLSRPPDLRPPIA